MKVADTYSTNLVNGAKDSRVMGFSEAGMHRMAKMMRDQIYTNKPWAVVREAIANAEDEHKKHGISRPVEISTPTEADPHLRIRDFACGLPREGTFDANGKRLTHGVFDTFFQYFESTKSSSNDLTGGFGIGAKSPLCYSELFFVTSWHNGKKSLYASVIDGNKSNAHEMSVEDSNEPSGIEVSVPIQPKDFDKFTRLVRAYVGMSQDASKFKIIPDAEPIGFLEDSKVFESPNGVAYSSWNSELPVGYNARLMVRDGDILYEVGQPQTYGVRLDFRYLVVNVKRGDVDLHPSRERVDGTAKTQRVVKAAVDAFYKDASEHAKAELAKCNSVKEAMEAIRLSRVLKFSATAPFQNWQVKRNQASTIGIFNDDFERGRAPGSSYAYDFSVDPTNYFVIVAPSNLRYDDAIAFAQSKDANVSDVVILWDTKPPCAKWIEGKDYHNFVSPTVDERKAVRAKYGKARGSNKVSGAIGLNIRLTTEYKGDSYWYQPTQETLDALVDDGFKIVLLPFMRHEPEYKFNLTSSEIGSLTIRKHVVLKDKFLLLSCNKGQRTFIEENYDSIGYDDFAAKYITPKLIDLIQNNHQVFTNDPLYSCTHGTIVRKVLQGKLKSITTPKIDRWLENLLKDFNLGKFIDTSKFIHPHQKKVDQVVAKINALNPFDRQLISVSMTMYGFCREFPDLHAKVEELLAELAK